MQNPRRGNNSDGAYQNLRPSLSHHRWGCYWHRVGHYLIIEGQESCFVLVTNFFWIGVWSLFLWDQYIFNVLLFLRDKWIYQALKWTSREASLAFLFVILPPPLEASSFAKFRVVQRDNPGRTLSAPLKGRWRSSRIQIFLDELLNRLQYWCIQLYRGWVNMNEI